MRFEGLPSLALFGLAASKAVQVRAPAEAAVAAAAAPAGGDDKGKNWHPHTKEPHFFNLQVDDRCDPYGNPPETLKSQCPMDSYAIRLEKGVLVATPYDKWWDPKLPTFFVDDDTQLYTVSKDPLQLYVDSVTGAVKYTKVGWLPPSAISTGFYHTGNNPIQLIDPSPSYLSWPSTVGLSFDGKFAFCPLGGTGQYQIFVNQWNFDQQGVEKQLCKYYKLAALNADPWKKDHPRRLKARGYPSSDDDESWDDDEESSWDEGSDSSYPTEEDSSYPTEEPEDSWDEDDEEPSYDTGKPSYSTEESSWPTEAPSYKTETSSYDTETPSYETGDDSWSDDDDSWSDDSDDGYTTEYDTSEW